MRGWSLRTVQSDTDALCGDFRHCVHMMQLGDHTGAIRQRQQRLHQAASAVGIDSTIVLQYTTAWDGS